MLRHALQSINLYLRSSHDLPQWRGGGGGEDAIPVLGSLNIQKTVNPSNAEASFEYKNANIFENHRNPVMLVLIG